jgi:hypothetical protein
MILWAEGSLRKYGMPKYMHKYECKVCGRLNEILNDCVECNILPSLSLVEDIMSLLTITLNRALDEQKDRSSGAFCYDYINSDRRADRN